MASYFPYAGNLTGSSAPSATVSFLGSANLYPVTADPDGLFLGSAPTVSSSNSIAIGLGNFANGTDSITIGHSAAADTFALVCGGGANGGNTSVSFGPSADASFDISIGDSSFCNNGGTVVGQAATAVGSSGIAIGASSSAVADAIAIGYNVQTGTVASGSAGLAVGIPADTVEAGAPLAADHKLYIMINNVRYAIPLTPI